MQFHVIIPEKASSYNLAGLNYTYNTYQISMCQKKNTQCLRINCQKLQEKLGILLERETGLHVNSAIVYFGIIDALFYRLNSHALSNACSCSFIVIPL